MKILLIIFLLLPIAGYCQFEKSVKLSEYKASNGKMYHVGDTIKLGRGSDADGYFRYVAQGGVQKFLSSSSDQNNAVDKSLSGSGAVIRKILSRKAGSLQKIVFAIRIDQKLSFLDLELYIEDAISTCEIVDCIKTNTANSVQPSNDKFDQLKKLKELLDSGALTKSEYDAQKKKLLDN